MGLMTFKGGVHPYDGKEFSKAKPVRKMLPKGELVFPLSQHIGAPASPIVNVGDYVLRGQKIAEAGGFVSSPIFSSVSGTVKAIEPRRVAVGDMVNSIIQWKMAQKLRQKNKLNQKKILNFLLCITGNNPINI